MNMEILDEKVLGNELWRFALAGACIVIGFLLGKFTQYLLKRASLQRAKSIGEENAMSVFFTALGKSMSVVGMAIGLHLGMDVLVFAAGLENITTTASDVLLVMAFGTMAMQIVSVPEFLLRSHAQKDDARMDEMLVPLVVRTIRFLVVAIVILQIIQIIYHKDITTILAGLGIASLAFGLAAQESIGNLFGSVFLFMNKPFDIGDRCNIDGHDGVIAELGLTCTRMERLDGHLVTIPNGQLYKKTIHNIGKRPFIRRIMNVTIPYDTTPEKIEEAVKILREAMAFKEGDESTKLNEPINQGELLPRVYFNEFNADSLNIICIYWYQPPAYWDFLEHSQWLNLKIFKSFSEAGIGFAFPSQTIYLAGDNKRPLNLPGMESFRGLEAQMGQAPKGSGHPKSGKAEG